MDVFRPAAPSLADKVAHLARPGSHAEGPRSVETIETHLSYVFLTDRYAYKLKKPVRDAFRDFTTLDARRLNCVEEVRLNRRLARDVYLGVAALTRESGALVLEGLGEPVEWLVKMRRLPRRLMLDIAMKEGRAGARDIARLTAVLCAFHRAAEPAPLAPAVYRARFERTIDDNRAALVEERYALDRALVERVTASQRAFLDANAGPLGRRAHALVEGHGDLRPEHACLADPPVVIDCLEFDRALRIIDPADEIGFLTMECAFLGQHAAAERVLHAWREATGDGVDEPLLRFYQSCRALTRAKLAAWHLDDAVPNGGRSKWIGQARAYLELASVLEKLDQRTAFVHAPHRLGE